MTTNGTMGSRIRQLRKARKQAQADVAAELDISRSHLAEIENGAHPGFATFVGLASYFSVSLDYLYSGSTPGNQDAGYGAFEGDEKVLVDFWRTLDEQQRRILLDLLVRDKNKEVA